MVMPVIVSVVVPTLDSATVLAALVVPICTKPKFKLGGKSFAVVVVPLRLTSCELPAALSVTLSAAVRVPLAVGLKVTLMLQLAPTANEPAQV